MRKFYHILLCVFLSGCDVETFMPGVNEQFGKQNFNSAVALIELHKTRKGSYPANLAELEHLGDWDQIWLNSVRYEKTETGYNLFVDRGFSSEPDLIYPLDFKQRLGLEDSNIKWDSE